MVDYRRRILSFKYAINGLTVAFREETNLKIHFLIAVIVILTSFWLNISRQDWINVILLIGLVITVELTNTAIEVVIDSFTEKEHPRAKFAKDVSAGAVLIVAITSFIIGFLIFLPYIWTI